KQRGVWTTLGRGGIIAVGDENLRVMPGPAKRFVYLGMNQLVFEHVLAIQKLPVGLDSLPRGGIGIGQGENLRREEAGIADLAQRFQDRLHLRVPEANRLAVAVCEMNMADEWAAGA